MRAHIRTPHHWHDRALMQWLFGQAAVTLAVGVMLVFYFLAVEGRAWSSLSEVAIGFAILAAAPAFAAVLFNRWRRGRG